MTPRTLATLLAGLCAGLVVALIGTGAEVHADGAARAGCAQWETMLATPSPTLSMKTTGAATETAPAGWEPFAYLPTGQLSYRRCTK